MSEKKAKKTKKVQLWCTDDQIELIDEAAETCGLTRTSFMVSASLEKARTLKVGSGNHGE